MPIEHLILASSSTSAASAFSSLMTRGGVVMWPLLFCSLLAGAVVFERLWVFLSCALSENRSRQKVEALYAELIAGRVEAAIALGQQAGPIGAFLSLGLQHRECGLTQGLEEAGQQMLERLRRRLSVLDTLVTLSPMLGILGTVTGIIGSFHLLGASDVGADALAVSNGIAEALLTTAVGLVVSMIALVPFNMFKAQVMQWARKLEQAGRHCELACAKGHISAP